MKFHRLPSNLAVPSRWHRNLLAMKIHIDNQTDRLGPDSRSSREIVDGRRRRRRYRRCERSSARPAFCELIDMRAAHEARVLEPWGSCHARSVRWDAPTNSTAGWPLWL
jgi:hypothetical protein